MSEQLSLGELLSRAEAKTKAESERRTKRPAAARDREDEIRQRINTLIQRQQAPSAPVSAPVMVTVPVVTERTEVVLPAPAPAAAPEVKPDVLTVAELNRSIKSLLEKNYPFVWVKGEISNFKVPGSGHMYFTLKDRDAQIKAVMFRGFTQGMKFRPADGMEVLVRARVTVYEPRGDYQLFCEVMEPVGFGALQIAFEQLKKKLEAEGLFHPSRKRPIPSFPKRIAIVTSPTGAAIRDMLNVLGRRFGGGLDVAILPASVQGDKAPSEIARAVDLASAMGLARFDVMIVGRGGGSLEDLWAFNTEEVARAVARATIPTISAVGHEVDFTICDFVADLRAPTPSAAAELVVKNKSDLCEKIRLLQRQMTHLQGRRLQLARAHLDGMQKRLVDPKRKLQDLMLRADEWHDRLIQSMQRYIDDCGMEVRLYQEKLGTPEKKIQLAQQSIRHTQQRLSMLQQRLVERKTQSFQATIAKLNALSPLGILSRGYSIVTTAENDHVLRESDDPQVHVGSDIHIRLHKGRLQATVTNKD